MAGRSGAEFVDRLADLKIDVDRDCWYTSATTCHVKRGVPTGEQVQWCRPNLINTIEKLKPRIIIPIGVAAVRAVFGHIWKEELGSIWQWVGWQIPNQAWNAWVCPLWHTSDFNGKIAGVMSTLQSRHFRDAVKMPGRPWDDEPVPDFAAQVECYLDRPAEVAKILRDMIKKGGAVAFDYEANMLNAFAPKAQIVTCSVCHNGKRTIAYPWHGEAIEATSELLQSRLWKIGANLPFETRWTIAHLGHRVRNWIWDTQQSSHVLNFAKRVNSVKFQGFVLVGQVDYKAHIEPYLKGKTASTPNRIHELSMRDLLVYNGIDSALEYEIALRQSSRAGIDLVSLGV